MYQKILVPIDGSSTATRGLTEAIGLARSCGASLALVYVVDAHPLAIDAGEPETWNAMVEGLRRVGRAVLAQGAKLAAQQGVATTLDLYDSPGGRVAERIVAEAQQCGCDLVVMGTHGRRGFSRAMLGSDAEYVLRSSPVPVLLVRHSGADEAST